MCAARSTYATIEDHLGPAEGRFFGTGFRRVSQRINDAVVDQVSGTIAARAGITYPADWSTKSAGQSLTPHVSTIDAAILGLTLVESYLTHTLDLDDEQRRSLRLTRIVIKAGAAPQEQLADFTVSAWHAGTTTEGETAVSVFDCHIGSLRVRCDISHPTGRRAKTSHALLSDDLLGDPQLRYYGRGFQARDHQLSNVELVPDSSEASADIRLIDTHSFPKGLGGRYQPSVTVIDGMVVLAQLAQSLLYHLDNIDRGQSDTLWMRRVEVSATTAEYPLTTDSFRSSTTIIRSGLVTFNGGRWRTSDWRSQFSGLRFAYRLAHRLPAPDLIGAAK